MTVRVGDYYTGSWDDAVEIVMVSPFGEIVYKFDDESIGYAFNEVEFEKEGFTPRLSTDGWVAVIHDSRYNMTMFGEGAFVTKENAINNFNENKLDDWTLLDVIHVHWNGGVAYVEA